MNKNYLFVPIARIASIKKLWIGRSVCVLARLLVITTAIIASMSYHATLFAGRIGNARLLIIMEGASCLF